MTAIRVNALQLLHQFAERPAPGLLLLAAMLSRNVRVQEADLAAAPKRNGADELSRGV